MFQVRVECIACHIVPTEGERAAGIVGRTFRPTEQACVNCHGEKYRGMLDRWMTTLARMREVIAPKLAAARAALTSADPKDPKHVRARQRGDDAAFNAEFVAVCTACHSAEVHKAVTATARTCTSCHHGSQNERCESCHRAQRAFYQGEMTTALAKVEPNVMANVVPCMGCHDFTKRHWRQAVGGKCVACHGEAYLAFLEEWTTVFDKEAARASEAVKHAEDALASARRQGGP